MKTQFETWWENDAPYSAATTEELCRIAWDNGAYCALNPVVRHDLDDGLDESPLPVQHNDCPDDPINFYPELDDDMDEPLGKACVLGDTDCESCS